MHINLKQPTLSLQMRLHYKLKILRNLKER